MGQTVEKPQWFSLHKGNSESEGFTKTNPRAQPKCLYLEKPEAFKLSRGGCFFRQPQGFSTVVRLWVPRGAGTDSQWVPTGKNLGKPQCSLYTVNPRLH